MTLQQFLFKNRSYTPLPFLVLMIVFGAPTLASMITGFLIAAAGEALRGAGVLYVGSETRVTGNVGASRLVTSGPFAYVRNPLYVGNMLLYLGIGVMSLALFPWLQLAAVCFFFVQYALIVREEETFLRGKFGEEYEAYARAVPRFLCRLTPYASPKRVSIDWNAGWKSEARTIQAFAAATILLVVLWLVK